MGGVTAYTYTTAWGNGASCVIPAILNDAWLGKAVLKWDSIAQGGVGQCTGTLWYWANRATVDAADPFTQYGTRPWPSA